MAFTIQTIPYNYMAGYSAVPIRVFESNWKNLENFDYVFNLTWDGQPISASTQYYIGENLYTRIYVNETTNYSAGDSVVIIDDNQINNGYYIIMKILNSTSMMIILSIRLLNTRLNLTKMVMVNWILVRS